MKESSDSFEQELRSSLNKMEEWTPATSPSMEEIKLLVHTESRERRRLFARDIALFALIAMGLIAMMLYSLMQSPLVFAVLQTVAFFTFAYNTILMRRRQNEQRRGDAA